MFSSSAVAHRTADSILVVNDSPDMLEYTASLLRDAGYYVLAARDGAEGWEMAQRDQPDLIISDVNMPRMDGFELCRRVRGLPELQMTPLLLVSALSTDTESAVLGLGAGADDYLEIPFDPIRLVSRVGRLIERKRAEEGIRETTERYRIVAETASDVIVTINENGIIQFVNPAAEAVFGYQPHELVGQPITTVMPPDQQRRHEAGLREYLRTRVKRLNWASLEVRGLRKDGREVPLELSFSEFFKQGRHMFTAIVRDISGRKMLEEQLRQAQRMEAIGRLAGGIAHDFNNLLTTIEGYSDLAIEQLRPSDPLRRDIEEINKAAQRAAILTRQLLAFSRKQVLQPKPLDLNVIVHDMEKMLRRLIGEHIEFRTLLEQDLGTVRADPGQIEQVIMNLVVNARDAMPKGGKMAIETANVDLEEPPAHFPDGTGPHVMLAVADSGVGMDDETQARIFEPFFTTKELGKGTGLGLSTVYGIVTQSGGHIRVTSQPNRGTTFKVFLPRAPEEAPQQASQVPVSPAVGAGQTVLVVEDETTVRNLVTAVLERHGYNVLRAATAPDGLAYVSNYAGVIHLLITDMVMPVLSGRELASKATSVRPDIKVLFMSGYASESIAAAAAPEPGAAFIYKPFSLESFLDKVRTTLGERRR